VANFDAKDPLADADPQREGANGVMPFDRREMVAVHDMLRREFILLPDLVEGVALDDVDRTVVVAQHIETVTAVLHHHHQGEDDYVWPLLLTRCHASAVELTSRMEEQHAALVVRLDDVNEALGTWSGRRSRISRRVLVDSLLRLIPPLEKHLHEEENTVVPLMEAHITAQEWAEVVRRGAADADPDDIPLGFGMLMYEADPNVIDQAIASMPTEIRPFIREWATRAYAEHSVLVHGTPTPPRSTEL